MGILNTPSATVHDRDADLYERIPDLGILNINNFQGTHVTKASVLASISPWLDENGISKDNFSLDGRTIDNNFVIRPSFGNGKSSRLLRNAKAALRISGDGPATVWRELCGQSSDTIPVGVKLFANFDESKKQRRENGGCRSLIRILHELVPNTNIRKNRAAVEWNGKPILRISAPTGDAEISLQFIDRFFKHSPFDAAAVKNKFNEERPQVVDEAEWQSL